MNLLKTNCSLTFLSDWIIRLINKIHVGDVAYEMFSQAVGRVFLCIGWLCKRWRTAHWVIGDSAVIWSLLNWPWGWLVMGMSLEEGSTWWLAGGRACPGQCLCQWLRWWKASHSFKIYRWYNQKFEKTELGTLNKQCETS